MVDEESILNAHICDGKLCLGQQRFKVLLLPEGGSLMEETVEKLEAWTKAGGSVLFYRTGLADEYRSGDRLAGTRLAGTRLAGTGPAKTGLTGTGLAGTGRTDAE
ncbi:MAG: hypothetical protein ACLTW9_14135 [Enterocloster sp.]